MEKITPLKLEKNTNGNFSCPHCKNYHENRYSPEYICKICMNKEFSSQEEYDFIIFHFNDDLTQLVHSKANRDHKERIKASEVDTTSWDSETQRAIRREWYLG
jgi:hypothetical protein